MRFATYTLRIECEEMQHDSDLDWAHENVPALVSEAERLVSDRLPEGWYAKIEDAPEWERTAADNQPAVRPLETYGDGGS